MREESKLRLEEEQAKRTVIITTIDILIATTIFSIKLLDHQHNFLAYLCSLPSSIAFVIITMIIEMTPRRTWEVTTRQ